MILTDNRMKELTEIVEHQSNMESLWLAKPSLVEAMLLAALRHLHAVIEGDAEIAERAKKVYWNLEVDL